MKRVLLLVIDALTAPLLVAEMDHGRYPHLQQLRKAGVLRHCCVSVFPAITHAALTSIATGRYPAQHGIVGTHWYAAETEKIAYFGSSLEMVLQKGLGDFFREFLLELNHTHLRAPTIFQQLERAGYKTACVNFPIYRGDVSHEINLPLLLKWIPGLPAKTTIQGPQHLFLGDLRPNPNDLHVEAELTGIPHWFGFRDENTIDLILQLAKTDEFPHFTLAYFPENDKSCHEQGPAAAHRQLGHIDEMLGSLFETYGGPAPFLAQFALVITGDHSQSETIADKAAEAIRLDAVLSAYQMAAAGQPWQDGDELMVCPNLRAAQIYFRQVRPQIVADVTSQLKAESRIDQLIYRADLTQAGQGYMVHNENGRLQFWRAAAGTPDRYGNRWAWKGELSVVDGRVQDDTLSFPNYPNAFERIAGVLDSPHSGHIWLTAKIGHEFALPQEKTHPAGGSHASLHRLDSQPPLLVAGAPQSVAVPEFPRITDIAPLCHALLKAD